jgi:hypothetical protein
VGPGRVERPTSRLSGVRSNHLSYEPETDTGFRVTSPRQSRLPRAPSRADIDGKEGKRRRRSIADCLVIAKKRHERRSSGQILRKEVIQPQVPLRLPCYDFTPVADPTVVACLPCGLAQRLQVEPTPMV